MDASPTKSPDMDENLILDINADSGEGKPAPENAEPASESTTPKEQEGTPASEEQTKGESSVNETDNTDSHHGYQPLRTPLHYWPSVQTSAFRLGAMKSDTQAYREFIESRELETEALHHVHLLSDEKARQEDLLEKNLSLRHDAASEINRDQERIRVTDQLIHDKQAEIVEKKSEIEKLKEKIDEKVSDSNLLNAFLLVVAGIGFIAAEIFITADVMINSIGMKGWSGPLFGLAIALLPFALKPAYDRIFEQPYFLNGSKKVMHWFLGITSVLVIITLGLSGYIRVIGKTVKSQVDNANTGADAISGDVMTQVLSDPTVAWVFILASILFAIAGAISFGIAFPVLKKGCNNKSWRSAIKKAHKVIDDLKSDILTHLNENISFQEHIARMHARLELLKPVEELELAIAGTRARLEEWLEAYYRYRRNGEDAFLRAAETEGRHYKIIGEPVVDNDELTTRRTSSRSAPRINSGSGEYLHQRLRRKIKNHLN